jgi:hypothetical protein
LLASGRQAEAAALLGSKRQARQPASLEKGKKTSMDSYALFDQATLLSTLLALLQRAKYASFPFKPPRL